MPVEILGAQIALWCFDLRRNTKFKVDIGISNYIDDLKVAIKDRKQNDFTGVDPDRLRLWRVNTTQDVSEEMLNDELVDASQTIGNAFPGVGVNVRVAVKAPDTEQPVAAPVENLANLFGQLDVSGGSGSVGTPSLSMILKAVVDNSETTRKSSEIMAKNSEIMAKNSETMIQFMKGLNRTEHATASVTRARAYQSTVFERVDEEYFLSKNNTYLGEFKSGGSVDIYLRSNPVPLNSEDDVQEWFNKLMKSLPKFTRKLAVKDTHTNTYLNGLKPDLSVFMEDDVTNDVYLTMFVQTLLEVKKRKSMSGLVDEDKGQVLDYIRILVQQQPLRELFAAFLSDGFYFYVMAYDRKTKKYSEFTTNLRIGLRLFWVLLNHSSPFTTIVGPKSIDFMTSRGNLKIRLKEYLGEGATSTVYKIDWEYTPSVIKVFKSGYDTSCEVRSLKFLKEQNFQNVPIYVAHDKRSIIIRPVCERIGNQFQISHAQQLLLLLYRIHQMNIYHRDVRPENILLDTGNNIAILADWGSAIQHKNTEETKNYEGTITFASPRILNNNFGPYIPKASDDLHSFIRTVYILRYPSTMPTIPDGDLALKARAIREYWSDNVDKKLDGPLWKEMVNEADRVNYAVIEKCCYVFNK